MQRRMNVFAILALILTLTPVSRAVAQDTPPPQALNEHSTVSIAEPSSAQFLNMTEGQNLSFSATATNSDPDNEMVANIHLMIGGALWESGPVTIPAGESGGIALNASVDFSILAACMNGEILVELGGWIGEVQVSEAAHTFPCSVGIDLPETSPVTIPYATITEEVCGPNNDLWTVGEVPNGLQNPATPIWQNNSLTFVYEPSPGFHIAGDSTQTLTDADTDCPPPETPPPPTTTETPTTGGGGGDNSSGPDTPGSTIDWDQASQTPTAGGGGGGGGGTIGGGQDNQPPTTGGSGPNTIIIGGGGGGGGGGGTIIGGGGGSFTEEYLRCDEGGGIGSHGGNYIPITNSTISENGGGITGTNVIFTNNTISGDGSHSGGHITINSGSNTIISSGGGGTYVNVCDHSITVVDFTNITIIHDINNPCQVYQGGGIYVFTGTGGGGGGSSESSGGGGGGGGGIISYVLPVGSNVTIWAEEASQASSGSYATLTVTEPNFIDLRTLPPGLFRVVVEPTDAEPIELYVRIVPNDTVIGLPDTGVGYQHVNLLVVLTAMGLAVVIATGIRVAGSTNRHAERSKGCAACGSIPARSDLPQAESAAAWHPCGFAGGFFTPATPPF